MTWSSQFWLKYYSSSFLLFSLLLSSSSCSVAVGLPLNIAGLYGAFKEKQVSAFASTSFHPFEWSSNARVVLLFLVAGHHQKFVYAYFLFSAVYTSMSVIASIAFLVQIGRGQVSKQFIEHCMNVPGKRGRKKNRIESHATRLLFHSLLIWIFYWQKKTLLFFTFISYFAGQTYETCKATSKVTVGVTGTFQFFISLVQVNSIPALFLSHTSRVLHTDGPSNQFSSFLVEIDLLDLCGAETLPANFDQKCRQLFQLCASVRQEDGASLLFIQCSKSCRATTQDNV